jgi:CRISPR/Cas system CSM-associated protein Csm2 small subunit
MIKKHLASPQGEEDFYDFRNQKTKLKVIRVDVNLPVYRMENFRTYTDQREYIAKEGLASDFEKAIRKGANHRSAEKRRTARTDFGFQHGSCH